MKFEVSGIIVDDKNNDAVSFYEGFGFGKLKATRNQLVLPITALTKLQ